MLFDVSKAIVEEIHDDLFVVKQIRVSVLRLDKIHQVVSGNKLFKLHYFLQDVSETTHKTITTFGGPYSNHLAATAFACKALQLKSIGIVRGEKPDMLSPTLLHCIEDGMQLKFVPRQQYDLKETLPFLHSIQQEFGPCTIIPEGGYNPTGAKGASLILDLIKPNTYSHICTATGTATTLAGLLMAAMPGQKIVSIPVLKGMEDIRERIVFLTGNKKHENNLQIFNEYHFGGYAKKNELLIQFMNRCFMQYKLPLDFVYTAKMMFGIFDSIKKDQFNKGSDILCLHTGGLQGNKSLTLGTLLY